MYMYMYVLSGTFAFYYSMCFTFYVVAMKSGNKVILGIYYTVIANNIVIWNLLQKKVYA